MTLTPTHDFKREVLGGDYDAALPVRNWLLYRLVAQKTGQDCDRIALAHELKEVQAAGFRASADTLNSFWTTYVRAIDLRLGETVTKADTHLLLKRYDADGYREINQQFAEFAELTHTRGNFALVPMYLPQGKQRYRSLNPLRGGYRSRWRDYWDLTLASIRTGALDDFFGRNPVHQQFDIPRLGGFGAYVRRHHLGAFLDDAGEVAPLWTGHLDAGAPALPDSTEQIEQFLERVTRAIAQRSADLSASEGAGNG